MNEVDLVQRLKERLVPLMKDEAERISGEFPSVTARFHSFPQEEMHGATFLNFGISCLIMHSAPDKPDLLDLCVSVSDVEKYPKVNADICWGHPSGRIEQELYPQPMEISEKALFEIESSMPTFLAKLRALLKGM